MADERPTDDEINAMIAELIEAVLLTIGHDALTAALLGQED